MPPPGVVGAPTGEGVPPPGVVGAPTGEGVTLPLPLGLSASPRVDDVMAPDDDAPQRPLRNKGNNPGCQNGRGLVMNNAGKRLWHNERMLWLFPWSTCHEIL